MSTTPPAVSAQLDFRSILGSEDAPSSFSGPCALEDDGFPFEEISDIAEIESWRKEINRPIYHIHKWWAQRLGSVFRAITLGALTPSGTDVLDSFYRPIRIKHATVFDPFMGSGTTLGEALKLGARVIGWDINPVAYFLVRNALSLHDHAAVIRAFREIERDIADDIKNLYKSRLEDGTVCDVLYYFWVKQVRCPECLHSVDLFSSRIFAKHACPSRNPEAKALCPGCGAVNPVLYDAEHATCACCSLEFNPQLGSARGQNASCPNCANSFPIAKTIRQGDGPPEHRLYAKLMLAPDGGKIYAAATDDDLRSYRKAERELMNRKDAYPVIAVKPGYNTNQALGYNYRYWHEMFNSRQLLCLSMLGERISKIADRGLRDLFACLFSGTLEFNNLFASYKGEGTGAVRHMFSHHILKPERMPLEANVWGTPKSSGSFMTMFKGRILRALDYAENSFELQITETKGRRTSNKVYGLSDHIGFDIADDFTSFDAGQQRVYLHCGDSGVTDIADKSVNAVITDPPFFDNVHYSQLADFFHVWQRKILGGTGMRKVDTTRSNAEVQNTEVCRFTERLGAVFVECHRVLADDGVFVFTYHHSRSEGWRSVLEALMKAGFRVTATHPVKSEMSVAMPKRQAKEPIDLDIVIVCRKRSYSRPTEWNGEIWEAIESQSAAQIHRLRKKGRRLSRNDVRIIVIAQLIKRASGSQCAESALALLDGSGDLIDSSVDVLHSGSNLSCGGGQG